MSTKEKCDEDSINNERYASLNVPTHGKFPKWLEELSRAVLGTRKGKILEEVQSEREFADPHPDNVGNSSPVPSRVLFSDYATIEKRTNNSLRPSHSAKFGRRSSLTAQLYVSGPLDKDTVLTKSDYLVPKFEMNANTKNLESELEKSWKSLNAFQQTHKGRLDSASQNESWNLCRNSELDDSLASYTPSFLGSGAHSRSKSEMSNYVPFYVYSNIRRATEFSVSPGSAFGKSKSTDDIYEHDRDDSESVESSGGLRLSSLPVRLDPTELIVGHTKNRRLDTYRMKVKEENRLRENIINELLSENERITESLMNAYDVQAVTTKHKHSGFRNKPTLKFEEVDSRNMSRRSSSVNSHDPVSFVIPELPRGTVLRLDILSTWGDRHYVGLNGLEIFTSDGRIANVAKISACPSDVNVLPENTNDPRVVANLLDGVNRTQDDVHLWLAPFYEGKYHYVQLEFQENTTIAMIRLWNYNKSRIHSFRGVRDVHITLDGQAIFRGEIAKACGGILGGIDAFGDTILFTTDEDILERISHNDRSFPNLTTTSEPDTPVTSERPPTAATLDVRPHTGAPPLFSEFNTNKAFNSEKILLGAHRLDLVLHSNWGFSGIIGLTGIEVIGIEDSIPVSLSPDNLSCDVKAPNLAALVDNHNVTTDARYMLWLPHKHEEPVVIMINFDDFTYVSGLRVWNYNQSQETSYAGVKTMSVLLDGKPLNNPFNDSELFLLRRAPGNVHYDYVQDVTFSTDEAPAIDSYSVHSQYKDEMPEGFVFQINIFSTWGDQYYCGLTEIELYDEYGKKIHLDYQNICAYPESINVLPGVTGDIRTPDKLIDSILDDVEGAHSWLAPIIPKCLNRIYVVLDQPVTVSLIKLWNYSKTPSRGIKEFAVLVDDLLVYNGILDKHTSKKKGPLYRSIIFTDDKSVLEREINTYIRHSSYGQEVMLLDQNRTTTGGSLPNPDQTLRPFTSVSPFDRGYTSQ